MPRDARVRPWPARRGRRFPTRSRRRLHHLKAQHAAPTGASQHVREMATEGAPVGAGAPSPAFSAVVGACRSTAPCPPAPLPQAHGNLAPLEVGTGVRPQRQSGARGCGEADAGRWAVSRWRRTAAVPRAPSSGPSPTQAAASSSLHTQLTLSPPPTHHLTTSHTTHTQHVQVLCPRRRGRV
jgi:hypothetical protein